MIRAPVPLVTALVTIVIKNSLGRHFKWPFNQSHDQSHCCVSTDNLCRNVIGVVHISNANDHEQQFAWVRLTAELN